MKKVDYWKTDKDKWYKAKIETLYELKYSGNLWNRLLQLLHIRDKKKEEYQIIYFGPIIIDIKEE